MSAADSAFTGQAALAPWFTTTCPGARQSFGDKDIAEAMAMANKNPEGAAITILLTTRPRLQLEWTLVDEFDQPFGRAVKDRSQGRLHGCCGPAS